MIKKLTFILAVTLFATAHAQWNEPVRISFDLGLMDPRTVAVDETLHVAASQGHIGAYYIRSSDNGISWSEPFAPADSFYGNSSWPDIIYSEGMLHFTSIGQVPDDRLQIFHLSSSDGGIT